MKHAIVTVFFIAFASLARADSWMPPTERVFSSANGKFLLLISPKALASFPELPEDRDENNKQRKASGLNEACYATLFQKDEGESVGSAVGFHPVWHQRLVNEVSPMDAYISDDGHYVVTTNDYGFLGGGDNVVVIYNSEGKLVRRYKLTEFIPQSEIDSYHVPQSTSSIYWAGRHSIDTKDGLLLLRVWQSGNPMNSDDKTPVKYRTVSIQLSTGEILKEPKPNERSAYHVAPATNLTCHATP